LHSYFSLGPILVLLIYNLSYLHFLIDFVLKKLLSLCVLCWITVAGYSQNKYWQQEVNVTINVSLNDKEHGLDAFESIEYINHSPDTLHFIWFHLWPNAYKNDRTAFSEQLLKNHRTDFYFSKPEQKGYINKLDFKADNATLNVEADSANIDVVKLILPKPLIPGAKTTITTPFHVKLPFNFSRGGHVGNTYQITQWFPKPAVYDHKGWHQMPYLDQGEFFSEFGNYDVEITAPSAYVIGATGVLQDAATLKQLKEKGKHNIEGTTKTWSYKQSNVHDFAWFASKDFEVNYDTVITASGKVVDVFVYHIPKAEGWDKAVGYVKDGIHHYSKWIGDYPYSVASVVQGPKNLTSGGMEYPTITLITTDEAGQELDATIVHEVGHNWFYGALASNERQHPWMDEGMNTFYQKRYELNKYGTYSHLDGLPRGRGKKSPDDDEQWLLSIMAKIYKDQPIETPSTKFTELNYGLITYIKASRWMKKLENELGTTAFDDCMKRYYNEWKFKHPYPDDFKRSIEACSGKDLNNVFIELYNSGPISASIKRPIKLAFLINLKDNDKYNYVNITPAIGYNNYDKVMLGAFVHNYTLPFKNFQFIGGALYGTGSGKLNGFGRAGYTKYAKTYRAEGSISYFNFTQNDFKNGDDIVHLGVRRITPSLKFTLYDKDPRSKRQFTAQWQSFFINEDVLSFNTVTTPTDTFDVVGSDPVNRYINRLSLTLNDTRKLYPYSINLTADQGKDFVRTGLTAKYFFNYAEENLGMSARFFAGKFFYTTPKTIFKQFQNERYFLNMTGPTGREDYTYSNYFIGRNEFEGWMSQQIMERDGFFKVQTEMREIGVTDDWLMSLNLVTDLPTKINPLRVLPFKIPLKIFLDVGTYAEAWKDNPATGRFIYNAGIQVPILGSLINVYIPLLYSKVYSDYIKTIVVEKKFLKSITFTIDVQKLKLRTLFPSLPL
jgi:hypothetical protein